MDAQSVSGTLVSGGVGAVVAVCSWVFRSIFKAQEEQQKKLAALEVTLAREYVPREEIEQRMDRMQESFEKRLDRVQESVDRVLDHLRNRPA